MKDSRNGRSGRACKAHTPQERLLSLSEAWATFQEERLPYLSPKTQSNYTLSARLIPQSRKAMRDYTPSDISKLLKGLQPGAYMVARGFLSSLFTFAIKQGWASTNPVSGTETRKLGKVSRWPRERVYEALSKIDNTEIRLVLELMYVTGQRLSDALAIKPDNIQAGILSLYQKKTGNWVSIPIPAEITNRLVALQPNPDKPFFNVRAAQVWSAWRKVRGELGMDSMTPHGLRKAASCEAAEGGASEAELQAMLGHKSTRAAALYRLEANAAVLASSAMSKRNLPC